MQQMLKKKELQRFNSNLVKQDKEDQRIESYIEDINMVDRNKQQQPKGLPINSKIARAQPAKQLFNKQLPSMLDKKSVTGPKPLVNGKVQDDTKYIKENSFTHLNKSKDA